MSKKKNDRKRSAVRLVALILCVMLVGTTIAWALMSAAGAEEAQAGTHSEVSMVIEEGAQAMRALQVTTYTNETGEHLREVIFALPVNALRRAAAAPFEGENAYPSGFTAGGARITGVRVNGEAANWGARGEGEEFIRVSCDIAPGAQAAFAFEYQVLLPEALGFAGTGEMCWRMTYCTLTPCAWADGAFQCIEMRAVGECDYYPAQDLTVTVDAPDTYLIAAGGMHTREAGARGRAVTTVSQEGARGFAMALGRRWTRYEGAAAGVAISCYANTGSGARRAIKAAQSALEVFCARLGDCPVAQISIAQADMTRDMESRSGLILVDKALFAAGQDAALEKAVALGLARQWFGLSVCNDPEREPWLSEALGAYMWLLLREELYGHQDFLREINTDVKNALNLTIPGSLTPDCARAQFSTSTAYQAVVRWRGAAVLHSLAALMDDDGIWRALRSFYQDNKGRFTTSDRFLDALSQAAGRDLAQPLAGYMASIHEYTGEDVG